MISNNLSISYGDNIYARICLNDSTMIEVRSSEISDFASLLTLMRSKLGQIAGLVKFYVRNLSKGWSREHRLMISDMPT